MIVNNELRQLFMNSLTKQMETHGRVARRQRRNREALIKAAGTVMTEKGIDAATMLEIAELADVGAGTVYNYFKSKDELAIAVLEEMMHELALRIERATATVEDPAEVYAFGVRTVLDAATTDLSWKQMLYRSEVIADALFRRMGPFAIRDLQRAVAAGRFHVPDPALVWHLTAHAIVGVSLSITTGRIPNEAKEEIVARLLCMTGIGVDAAKALARRPRPAAVVKGLNRD
ncbi:TetR/AcrR family transcriptional regulator [Caballeronia sp. DA-9]|uniref:TetR/AcrR family transcriptional regulator n=1 Tax=Caballeronia sp. DA-9 TaxID=3436237 RepID=UPI003F66FC0F